MKKLKAAILALTLAAAGVVSVFAAAPAQANVSNGYATVSYGTSSHGWNNAWGINADTYAMGGHLTQYHRYIEFTQIRDSAGNVWASNNSDILYWNQITGVQVFASYGPYYGSFDCNSWYSLAILYDYSSGVYVDINYANVC